MKVWTMEQEAERLTARFQGLNRAKFARDFAVPGGGAMINQHMKAIRPISLDAGLAYSKGFGVDLKEISPRLAKEITRAVSSLDRTNVPALLGSQAVVTADTVTVPVLSNGASMGHGNEVLFDDVVTGGLTLSNRWVFDQLRPTAPDALRFISGHGDSMAPTFTSGDVLLVDTGINEVRIDGVFVLKAHDRLFVKRVRQRMDGSFEISSDNPTHKTVDTLNGGSQVEVLGRVVWVWNGRKL